MIEWLTKFGGHLATTWKVSCRLKRNNLKQGSIFKLGKSKHHLFMRVYHVFPQKSILLPAAAPRASQLLRWGTGRSKTTPIHKD